MKQSTVSISTGNIPRRLLATKSILIALFVAIIGCSNVSMAEFEEGKHYFKVENAQPGTGDMSTLSSFLTMPVHIVITSKSIFRAG